MAHLQRTPPSIASLQIQAANVTHEVTALRRMARHSRSRVILAAVALDLRSFDDWLRADPDESRRQTLEDALDMIQRRLRLVRHVLQSGGPEATPLANSELRAVGGDRRS
jgi:hypothetical protein